MEERSLCSNAWVQLLDDWKKNGGGILDSMAATREQISKDQRSDFARLVRESWKAQSQPTSASFGDWPVPNDNFRIVIFSIDANGLVPKACEAPIWQDDWLYFEILTNSESWTVRRLPEMTVGLDATDHHSGSNWLFYWLFARIDESSLNTQ